jgi:hypothetical protein
MTFTTITKQLLPVPPQPFYSLPPPILYFKSPKSQLHSHHLQSFPVLPAITQLIHHPNSPFPATTPAIPPSQSYLLSSPLPPWLQFKPAITQISIHPVLNLPLLRRRALDITHTTNQNSTTRELPKSAANPTVLQEEE